MNLAEQLKKELTERANDVESSKNLLNWVMNEFRNGSNPVIIKITSNDRGCCCCKETLERINYKADYEFVSFKYENGRHYAKRICGEWADITDLDDAQKYACNGVDVSDKTLFLEKEGFRVYKTWVYGLGDILEIRY